MYVIIFVCFFSKMSRSWQHLEKRKWYCMVGSWIIGTGIPVSVDTAERHGTLAGDRRPAARHQASGGYPYRAAPSHGGTARDRWRPVPG